MALIIEVSHLSTLWKNFPQSHLIKYLRECLQNNLTLILKIFHKFSLNFSNLSDELEIITFSLLIIGVSYFLILRKKFHQSHLIVI